MKKSAILFGALLGLVSITANAQTTATATVNVRLHPIQTIIVNPSNQNVNLDYNTEADYLNGVDATQADHLTVYSTGAFAVTVKSDTDKLKSTATGVTEDIEASDIFVTASAGTTNALEATGVTYEPAVSLKTTPTALFSSTIGGVNKNVNVNYAAKGDLDAYVNKYFNVENPTVYTTTVTYTIAAQ
ncbi:hypothetical protein ACX3PU_02955 [Chryseobacterium sp. A301]